LLPEFRSLKKVLYSGSAQSAKHIFETMTANRFIDCNLFFGGKDAAFVGASADLQFAAREIVKYAFYNNGQSYDCIKRVYLS
jgi:acyl-CoA reductase-like NAD-dependent aldehyde dehydrogenase